MERFEDQALVLGTVDYGEADRVVTLFTRSKGKLSAFAAGARKSKRRFAGALEPFTLVKAFLVETRGSTHRMDAADIERSFPKIRQDLSLMARALYGVELCRELTRDHEPHPELLDLVLEYLELFEAGQAGPTSLLAFELRALAIAGLMPRFDACCVCAQALGRGGFVRARFDPAHGGAVCDGCGPRAPHGMTVTVPLMDAMRGLQQGARQPFTPELRERARVLLNVFIEHHLGRRLKSVDFMRQVGLD